MKMPANKVSEEIVADAQPTHCPNTLFIRNMSILSTEKTARSASSQIISFLFEGF